jgi:hypothetical protein
LTNKLVLYKDFSGDNDYREPPNKTAPVAKPSFEKVRQPLSAPKFIDS